MIQLENTSDLFILILVKFVDYLQWSFTLPWFLKLVLVNNYILYLGMMVLDQRVLRYKANNVIVIEELDEEVVKEQMLIAFNQ